MISRANMARQALLLVLACTLLVGCERWRAEWAYQDALSSLNEGDYDRARTVFLQVATSFPNYPRAAEALYRRMRLIADQLGEADAAELAFRDLLRRYPDSKFAQQAVREKVQELVQNRSGARQGLKLADFYLSRYPNAKDRIEMRRHLAHFFAWQGHFQQAQIELEEAGKRVSDRKSRAEILYDRAEIAFYAGALSEAIGFASQVTHLVEGSLAARGGYLVALSLEEDGQLDAALRRLFSIQDSYPNPRVIAEKIVAVQDRIKRRKQ